MIVGLVAALAAVSSPAQARVPGWDDPVLYPPEVSASDDVVGGELRVGEADASGVQNTLVLEHTSVYAEVSAGIVDVTMTQWFSNPYDVPIEATYLLPLPEGAAVNRMRLTCGGRVVDGFVAERGEARAIYEAAKADGRKAALLEETRNNLFRQSISNLCPGEEVEIEIGWVEQAALEDSVYSWTLPLTVGPRFSPPWVEDAAELVTPYADDGRRVDVSVAIEEGMPVEGLWSDTHDIGVVDEGAWGAEVAFAADVEIPNRDFALDWTLGGESVRAAVVAAWPDPDDDGYFALTVEPPGAGELDPGELRPRELVFLIDESCSMSGEPYEVAKAAVTQALRDMRPSDTFNVMRFSDDTASLFLESQPSTRDTRASATAWLEHFDSGATYMENGLRAALSGPARPNSMRLILLLTDGFVGDDDMIASVVRENLGNNRVFALGVSSSPNRSLLARVAEMGRGAVLYHRPGTSVKRAVDTFYQRIARPAFTDVVIDWGGLDVDEVYPSRTPDLWAGQVLRVVGRFSTENLDSADVVVSGYVGRRRVSLAATVDLAGALDDPHAGVATLWARRKVADLDGANPGHATGIRRDEIVDVALEHSLVTRYTSLVAVDEAPGTCGPGGVTVEVPNEAPSDMSTAGLLGYGSGGGYGVGYGLAGGGRYAYRGRASIGVVASEPMILGSIDHSLIDAVIKRNLAPIRYCYQRELQKNPALAGKVQTKFVVAADGSVASAEVRSSTLGSPEAEACLLGVLRRMAFPAPAGGGIVVVTYPFVFAGE
ncbi:inter-alpha-trypsin inhibitor domain-containing protein [Deltaproteobacteria bacterium]|nr:inter-alpha-trypsin inhibitor domain-containing protein [Deltaproteobacteria bacterium]